jgi:hypothetical protein
VQDGDGPVLLNFELHGLLLNLAMW